MTRRLPRDVVTFLLDNPTEVESVKYRMQVLKERKQRQEEYAERRRNAKTVECGVYGCKNPKNELDTMCKSCYQDYLEDPDAYK